MVQLEKNDERNPGDRLPIGAVKTEIINYVLSKNDAVPVTDLIRHLNDKWGIRNKRNISKHLDELKDKYLEKISPEEKGKDNKWDITKTEHLKNINQHFDNIKLNSYDKAIKMILRKNGYRVTDLGGFFAYIWLLLSDSFFNACIDTSISTLTSRSLIIYGFNNAGYWRYITKKTNECYIDYTTRYPNIEISNEDFVDILTGISGKHNVINSYEVFTEVWKENIQKFVKEKSNKIEDDQNIYISIYEVFKMKQILMDDFKDVLFLVLFESYFVQDVLLNKVSEEEKIYAINTKANYDDYSEALELKKDKKESLKNLILSDLVQVSKIMFEHKKPKIFDEKIYFDQKDIENALKEFFNDEIKKFVEN